MNSRNEIPINTTISVMEMMEKNLFLKKIIKNKDNRMNSITVYRLKTSELPTAK
jgi:hypothetical protein